MNSINIEFVGLMYRNTNKSYKYQLSKKNQNTTWTELEENSVKLSYLSPGKYTFNVIAINEDGIESSKPAQVSFTINPPYWKTWWFKISGSVLLCFIILITYKIRIKEIHKRNKLEKDLLKQVNKFRQQALSQQMNPHFIFNTLNSIQYFIFQNDTPSSIKYLTKFSKLMRLVLDNSQHDTIPLQKEMEAMELYLQLESLRLENSIHYKIIIDDRMDLSMYHIYPLLIQPYVENAIWHGLVHKDTDKKLQIEVTPSNDSILCTIEDNGIGREAAMVYKKNNKPDHKSHGLNITDKRIESINKLYNSNYRVEIIDLKDHNNKALGTKVNLQIPIIKSRDS